LLQKKVSEGSSLHRQFCGRGFDVEYGSGAEGYAYDAKSSVQTGALALNGEKVPGMVYPVISTG
jgi:hypothetical protein